MLIYWDQYFTDTPAAVTSMNQFVTDLASGTTGAASVNMAWGRPPSPDTLLSI